MVSGRALEGLYQGGMTDAARRGLGDGGAGALLIVRRRVVVHAVVFG